MALKDLVLEYPIPQGGWEAIIDALLVSRPGDISDFDAEAFARSLYKSGFVIAHKNNVIESTAKEITREINREIRKRLTPIAHKLQGPRAD